MKTMAKKPRKPREVPSNDRVLVQALVDPPIKAWLERMAAERDMKAGPYLRSLLRWAKDTHLGGLGEQTIVVVPLTKKGKPMKGKSTMQVPRG